MTVVILEMFLQLVLAGLRKYTRYHKLTDLKEIHLL